MVYTVFGDKGSGAFSAEAALAEAGAPYDAALVSLDRNEQRTAGFFKYNPSGKVPALRTPDGEIVTESAAILLAIADRFPQSGLLPPTGARSQAYRWIAFMASEVYPIVEISDYPARFAPEGEQAKALRRKAHERIQERLLIVESAIHGPWMLSSGFSAVDIYVAMFTRWRGSVGRDWVEGGHIPRLMALASAVSERPNIAPVWARHFGG